MAGVWNDGMKLASVGGLSAIHRLKRLDTWDKDLKKRLSTFWRLFMANEKNLIPLNKRPKKEAREIQKKGCSGFQCGTKKAQRVKRGASDPAFDRE